MKVKMFISLDIDEEEYPVPADGRVDEELEDAFLDLMHDIEGITVKSIRAVMENKE
tara:strand:- start:243 stop:410 length:168 start_codon:yes stop_codon:yes gene_type:complete